MLFFALFLHLFSHPFPRPFLFTHATQALIVSAVRQKVCFACMSLSVPSVYAILIDVVRFMMRKLFCIKEFILSYANLKISL